MVMNIIARDRIDSRAGCGSGRGPAVLRWVGHLPEERGLYKKMTVLDVIVFFAALRGMRESVARSQDHRAR